MNITRTNFADLFKANMNDFQKLTRNISTGKRINSGGDDSAGLNISTRLTSQIRGTEQALRNLNDGMSILQTRDGSLSTTQEILQRARELVIQGKNDTYSAEQKASIQQELNGLMSTLNKVSDQATFNDIPLLSKGKAVSMDGIETHNQKVTISGIPVNTAPGANTTVEFWMYWKGEDPGTNANQIPFGWDNNYDVIMNDQKIGVNTGRGEKLGINTTELKDKWTHIAITFTNGVPDDTNTKLFVNGEEQNISRVAGWTAANRTVTDTIHIGGWGADNDYDFNGYIDELKIWDGTRTQTQVKDSMYSSQIGTEDKLLGYWKLDDKNLKDKTANQNSGKLENGTQISDEGISNEVTIHTGYEADNSDSIGLMTINSDVLNLNNIDLSNPKLLDKIDAAIAGISTQRSEIGTKINQFSIRAENAETLMQNTAASRMRIEEADMADSLSSLTKLELKQSTVQKILMTNNRYEEEKMTLLVKG